MKNKIIIFLLLFIIAESIILPIYFTEKNKKDGIEINSKKITTKSDGNNNTNCSSYSVPSGILQENLGNLQKLIQNNEIDKKYKATDTNNLQTTQDMVKYNKNYELEWEKQLEYIYNLLLNKLDGYAKKKLILSQDGWKQYKDNHNSFVGSIADKAITFAGLSKINFATKEAEKTRARAIELMDFLYSIDSNIEMFYYNNTSNLTD